MKIFLLGFMAAGKSTYGRKLASALDIEFIDLDQYIEKKHKVSIPSIFNLIGESGFRIIEHRTLLEVLEMDNYVLSTGGGTPCFFDNIKLLNDNGKTFYLQINADIIVSRLLKSKRKRPLVQNLSQDELQIFVSERLVQREEFYLQAQHIIYTFDKTQKEIIEEIIELLSKK